MCVQFANITACLKNAFSLKNTLNQWLTQGWARWATLRNILGKFWKEGENKRGKERGREKKEENSGEKGKERR